MNTAAWLEKLGASAAGEAWRARLPQLVVWALALALGAQAAVLITRLGGAGRIRPGPAVILPAAAPPPQLNVVALANEHLFGAPPPPPAATDANAPQSRMPLVLAGIFAAADPKAGLAILGPTAANAKVYAVGQRVPGNARVHAVYPDRVLLERDGNLEALLLPRQPATGPARAAAPAGPSALDRVRRAITDEPGLISDVLRPQPVFVDGRQQGYRVYPGRNARAFASLGLHNGDLVTAVNGTPLDDPNRGMEVFRTLSSSDMAHVTVMRNGQQQDLTLNMSQIASEAEQLSGAGGATGAAEGAAQSSGATAYPGGPRAPPGPDAVPVPAQPPPAP